MKQDPLAKQPMTLGGLGVPDNPHIPQMALAQCHWLAATGVSELSVPGLAHPKSHKWRAQRHCRLRESHKCHWLAATGIPDWLAVIGIPPHPSKTTTGPLSSCLLNTRQKHHLEEE